MRRSLTFSVAAGLFIGVAVGACWRSGPEPAAEQAETSPMSIEEVQDAYSAEWMRLPGVIGTGIGLCDGQPCIKVLLSASSPEAERAIPDEAQGYPVVLEVTGDVRPR